MTDENEEKEIAEWREQRRIEDENIDNFLNGRWVEIPDGTLSDFIEAALYDFKLGHNFKRLKHESEISLSPKWHDKSSLVDAIMLFSYSCEPIDLSVSRLANAAKYLGFNTLSPYSAAVCYALFKSLQKEYQSCRKKQART